VTNSTYVGYKWYVDTDDSWPIGDYDVTSYMTDRISLGSTSDTTEFTLKEMD
ncbi:unnamed protein product, partial [marine sediment metagenome]